MIKSTSQWNSSVTWKIWGWLTDDPLDPDHIIASTLWYKVLQAPAEVVAHSLTRLSQVGLGFVQELLCDIHHIHSAEERQQQAFGDSPNARSTVQGTTPTCFPLPLLQQKTKTSQLKCCPQITGYTYISKK